MFAENLFKNLANGMSQFEQERIAQSKDVVSLPGGKAYISYHTTRSGSAYAMAWVFVLGLRCALRIRPVGQEVALSVRSQYTDELGKTVYLYRPVGRFQSAYFIYEAWQGKDRSLPKTVASVTLDLNELGQAIIEALQTGKVQPIDHEGLGIAPLTQEQQDAKLQDWRKKNGYDEVDQTAAAVPAQAPVAPLSSLNTEPAVTGTGDVDTDYDPFAVA